MRLGSSIKRRRGGRADAGSDEEAGAAANAQRLMAVAAGVIFGGFFLGWLVATQMIFPRPDPPGDLYEVPDVYGLTLEEATERVTERGLDLGLVDAFRHPVADSGVVVGQAPLPGQLAAPGRPVRISVSLGPERRPVPDVAHLRGDRARMVLEMSGFQVAMDSVESELPRGRVVSLEPAPGTALPLPGEVRVVVSIGPAQVILPALVGLPEAEARAAVEALGLVISTVEEAFRFGADQGLVVEQEPEAGALVEAGSAVRLVVGREGAGADTLSEGNKTAPPP